MVEPVVRLNRNLALAAQWNLYVTGALPQPHPAYCLDTKSIQEAETFRPFTKRQRNQVSCSPLLWQFFSNCR